jgi:hypothetical protein
MKFEFSATDFHNPLIRPLSLAVFVALFGAAQPMLAPARAQEPSSLLAESPAYRVSVENVSAKVGAHTVIHAILRAKEGFRILKSYENRVARFSSADDGVAFDEKIVRGHFEDDSLVFDIGVTPTKPGAHPINGVFRVGYLQGNSDLSMVSLPLIATVTGTE